MYFAYIKNNVIQRSGQAPLTNSDVMNIPITEEIYNNLEKYIWNAEKQEIILNPNYEQEQAQKRERNFNKEFFNTSLGYVRRKFTNKNGEIKDFLSDAFPSLLLAFQNGIIGEIFVYDKPSFTEEVIDWTLYQHKVNITQQFIQDCFTQSRVDFFGV